MLCYNSNGGILTMIDKYKKIIMEHIHKILPLTKIQGGNHTLYKTNCLVDKSHPHSMYYNPSDGTFTCLVCRYSKDIISLCADIKNVDEWAMLEKILKIKLGMDTRSVLVDAGKEMFKNELLYQINYDSMLFFEEQLQKNPDAMKYLTNRGLTKETIQRFHLGYAPKYNKLHRTLRQDFEDEDLEVAGVVGKDEKTGKYYDIFKDRIIFPIIDRDDQILGFGGRVIGGNSSPKKYINTKTTEIFQKSKCLYALNMVNLEKKPERILVCEGYMDVIALHQEGIDWAVGTLGTALTPNHYLQLKKFTDNPTVIFDGDDAGINAANRVLQKVGKLDVLTLPEGKDPDEYIETYGKESFLQYVQGNTKTWEEYWFDQYKSEQKENENIFEYLLGKFNEIQRVY